MCKASLRLGVRKTHKAFIVYLFNASNHVITCAPPIVGETLFIHRLDWSQQQELIVVSRSLLTGNHISPISIGPGEFVDTTAVLPGRIDSCVAYFPTWFAGSGAASGEEECWLLFHRPM